MYTKYAKLRDERGLTDLAVANAVSIPQSTFYDWKQRSADNEKAGMSVGNLMKLAQFFDVPIEYFLENE